MESNTQDILLDKKAFGDDFVWGVSTAALQIEGAHDLDGKSPSIWDTFSAKKGKILNGHHHYTACDFYNCYEQDIDLVKKLNIPNFRFSIAWTRVLPNGTGEVNQTGIDHYHKVIDYCLKQGIEPWVTIYHWDLPQALQDLGGGHDLVIRPPHGPADVHVFDETQDVARVAGEFDHLHETGVVDATPHHHVELDRPRASA